jgi:uncharacterized phage-associated protein
VTVAIDGDAAQAEPMAANPGTKLSSWVLAHKKDCTHLALQKLCFYGYGIARALDATDLGLVTFEAWKHGPVCPEVWFEYKDRGREPIRLPPTAPIVRYDEATEDILRDVVCVYGELSAWELREQSHLETPWLNHQQRQSGIPDAEIVEHFRAKFGRPGEVMAPEYLFGTNSFALDGLPVAKFDSLKDLANELRQPT